AAPGDGRAAADGSGSGPGRPALRFDDDIRIAAYGHWLPAAMTATEAVHLGLCEQPIVDQTGMVAVTVAETESAPEMAVKAGRTALTRSGFGPDEVDLLLHSALYYQGHDMWASASYVQRMALGTSCPAIEIRQTSNGGMAALELAANYLT